MKVTLREIVNSQGALERLMVMKMSFATGFKLAKLAKEVGSSIEIFIEKRNDLIRELGVENDKGELNIPADDKESLDKFTSELNKAMEIEIDITSKKIKISEFGNLEIEPADVAVLTPFLGA